MKSFTFHSSPLLPHPLKQVAGFQTLEELLPSNPSGVLDALPDLLSSLLPPPTVPATQPDAVLLRFIEFLEELSLQQPSEVPLRLINEVRRPCIAYTATSTLLKD